MNATTNAVIATGKTLAETVLGCAGNPLIVAAGVGAGTSMTAIAAPVAIAVGIGFAVTKAIDWLID